MQGWCGSAPLSPGLLGSSLLNSGPLPASWTAAKAVVDLSHPEHHDAEVPDYPYLHSAWRARQWGLA